MSGKRTICLNMIVKNEAHIIAETLEHLLKFMTFDYWVISDTGSTDKTKEIITDFFKSKNIPGEIVEHAWQDFGYNRTKAFEAAYNKTDYVFVWDADDEISGDFKMPNNLTADSYKFTFGNADGFRYSRPQLFNNRKRWCYKGVLHEYAACMEACGPDQTVPGNYYFISGRKGDRSKDPNKYLKDALVLEKAIEKAIAEKDPLYNRYVFYCAQSYNSCNVHDKAIEYYKKALTIDMWIQEKYVSCLEIYDQYELINRASEGLYYLVESYKYDTTRVEGIYRLIKYYCINGPIEAAYMYYSLIKDFYENHYDGTKLGEKLFAKKGEYDFFLPYYMIIVAQRTNHIDVAVKMYEKIFKYQYVAPEWWIRNLVHNFQFCVNNLPTNTEFLYKMLNYFEVAKVRGVTLQEHHNNIIMKAIDKYRDILAIPGPLSQQIKSNPVSPRVMMTITTCKRLDLFTKTVNSILNNWTDVSSIDYFYCVDDNSSDDDRAIMQAQYPFFNYYMKAPSERGHRESMNIIWSKLAELKPTYWIHLEDDWLYFRKEAYVTRGIAALEKYEPLNIHQVVFNRNYGLMYSDLDRVGGIPLEPASALGPGIILHEKREGLVGKNCGYWPHYSLQPSVMRTRIALELGNYNSPNKFFERDYADRYHAKGYMTAFFNSIYSIHIGKQHWEKDGKNAYALNEIPQFNTAAAAAVAAAVAAPTSDTTITITDVNASLPANGTMREHLNIILDKIRSGTPFGLIRPSDGERTVMLGQTLTNCDHWTFKEGGALQKELLAAVQTVDKKLYIGIPCNTCCKPWNCTPTIYNDFIEKFKIPLAQRTYANIFGNSNWQTFSEFIQSYKKGFFLITSGTAESSLTIKERFIINDKLVNTWDTDGATETERLLQFIGSKKGELILFSAGPLSKVWIPKCMKANPENMYVDVGGSIDVFTKGKSNRFYTNQDHPFAKETCRFDTQKQTHEYQGYSYVFNSAIEGFNKITDKNALFQSFRAQRTIYGFTENGDVAPDQEAITIAKNINEEIYNEYVGQLKDRKAVGYEGSTNNYASYNNLDSRHIMMSTQLFSLIPEPVKTVVEIGGGYGNWVYLNRAKDFDRWVTIDLPHVSELQKWYLSETGVNMDRWKAVSAYDYAEVESLNVDLVIGAHSLSELALDLFEDYFKRVISKSKYFYYCYHVSRPTLALIEAKNKLVGSQFKLLHSVLSENGHVNNCLYVNTISKEEVKKKNLIYMCAFGSEEYYKLLELTIVSTKLFSKTDGVDFLLFTSKEFEPRVLELCKNLDLPIQTVVIDTIKTPHDAASYKMSIFDYKSIDSYSKILFLDIDIIVQGNLLDLFDHCVEDKLYTVNQSTIGQHPGLGSTLFDFSKIDRNTLAINTGVLLFNNSTAMRNLFSRINKHIDDYKSRDIELPPCYEQPFVNLHAIMTGMYDVDTLTRHVKLCQQDPMSPLDNKQIIINHFFDNINGSTKSKRMSDYLRNLLNTYSEITNNTGLIFDNSLFLRKMYTWGSGRIVFEMNGLIINTWSRTGNYQILSSHIVKASWSGFEHIVIFNNSYTRFSSIRISDICIGSHAPDTTLVDMIPIPSKLEPISLIASKNLLYFCVFHNKGYFDLLNILLSTIKKNSNLDNIDILVLTSGEFEPVVKSLSNHFNITISLHKCDFKTQHEAGCARLFIFDYPRIHEYAKILYMDCDIVVQGDISKLFSIQIEEKVYAKKEYTVGGEGHGGWFFDFSKVDEKSDAINSGVLLFRNCTKIRSVFNDIRTHIDNLRKTTTLLPLCMDQSFIIYHLFKNCAYDNELISPYIYLAEFTQPPVLTDGGLLISHFVWPIGNTGHKMNRMIQHKSLLDTVVDT